jgi:hypothetical protein
MDMVHGSWTDGAPGSTVDRSGAGTGAVASYVRHAARWAWGLTGRVDEGEQSRARPGDDSPRWDWWRRGGVTGPKIATAVASWRRRRKRLGGEEK